MLYKPCILLQAFSVVKLNNTYSSSLLQRIASEGTSVVVISLLLAEPGLGSLAVAVGTVTSAEAVPVIKEL